MKKTMTKVLLGLMVGGTFGATGLSGFAGATTWDPGPTVGSIEICKAAPVGGLVTVTPASFSFSVTNANGSALAGSPFTVPTGACTSAIPASAGLKTITELGFSPTYSVTAITQLPGGTYLTSTTLSTGTAVVNVTAGITAVVTYTNKVNTGYLEICKSTPTGSGLTGPFTFNVAGPTGTNFTTSATVSVGSCSLPFLAPVGTNTITEAGTNQYITGITAFLNANPATTELVSANTTTGVAQVTVTSSSDPSNQTDVTYTNNVVALKVCKVLDMTSHPFTAGNPVTSSTLYPFTEAVTSGIAGPNTAPPTFSIPAGTAAAPVCSNPVTYRPGTVVTITEGIVPGSQVELIKSTGALSENSQSIANRTVSITIGTLTTSGNVPGNEAIVTFTNEYAAPGTLKICKITPAASTTPLVIPSSGTFSFSVTGVTNPVVVPVGACVIVGTTDANGTLTPTFFPFNSSITVTEAGKTANMATAVSVIPTFVTTSGPTAVTTEANPPTPASLGGIGGASSVTVLISSAVTTEVTFTNVDPPAVGDIPVTVANPVSAATTIGGPGTTTAFGFATATQVASTIPALVNSKTGSLPALSVPKLTPAQRHAALVKDQKSLAKVNASIANMNKLLKGHLKSSVRKADLHRLAQLKSEKSLLNQLIKALK